jgi:hypothetical protein
MTDSPRLPIPAPQTGDKPGSWAYKTVSTRFPATARRIFGENNYSEAIAARLHALIAEIPHAPIRAIEDPGSPDLADWGTYVAPYLGKTWHQPPWFFTENYFYRRILEATRYFQPGDGGGLDPFHYQKQMGLQVARDSIHHLVGRVSHWLAGKPVDPQAIVSLLYLDLWGNQADLSLWPAERQDKPDHTDPHQALSHLLVDDSHRVAEYLLSGQPHPHVDFLIDIAGFVLVGDLVLADFFLATGIASSVVMHVKPHPTYVSDALEADLLGTINYLCEDDDRLTKLVGNRLKNVLAIGQLQVKHNWFWTSPLAGWQMPASLREAISQTSLVISKGDAHYRRLLGDRHWPYDTPFEDILAYYPVPLVALRTLKSELVAGLEAGQVQKVSALDPEWMIGGRWGLLQFR